MGFMGKVRKGLTALVPSRFRAQRVYPPEVSRRQIEEEIPVSWRADNLLWGYVTKYMLKGSGAGFVTPPYTAYWERLWGATPIEDLPKYKDLYAFVPYIKASIDVTVNLAISNGFELEGGPEPIRQWLSDWLEEQNILQTLRVVASDMLIFGNAYLELCRNEDTGAIEWLKPLDPVHMRVRRDAYGQVLGYIQLLTFPPVVFTAQDIVHFKWGAKSWTYEQAYGTSLLRPLLKIQALIDQLEDDMAVIVHCYDKDTQVLTENGWKHHYEWKRGEKIAVFDPRTGKVFFEEPKLLFKTRYEGKMYHFKSEEMDFMVTPNHTLLYKTPNGIKRGWISSPAESLPKGGVWFRVNGEFTDGVEFREINVNEQRYNADDFIEFLGYYISEGGVSWGCEGYSGSVMLVQKLGTEQAIKIENCLKRLFVEKLKIRKDEHYVRWFIHSVELCKWLDENCGHGAREKKIPRWLFNASKRQLKILFDALMLGDGSSAKRKGRTYSVFASTSKHLADDFQELALRLGKKVILRKQVRDVYGIKDYISYRVCMHENYRALKHDAPVVYARKSRHLKLEDYNGEIYCFSTSTGFYITRRNGYSIIQGNTYAKPMLVVKAGTPERPFADRQLQSLVDAFKDRKPATDVFVRGDVDVQVIPSLTKDVNITWWLDYLYTQREAVLGVPKIFMGKSEGTNRATAEVVMQEYVTRLRMMQEIMGDQLETCLFKQMIEGRFGKGIEVPRIKWKPIWEPTVQDKAKYLCDLVDKGIILPKEARKELGFPEEYPIAKMEELQAVLARNGAKGWEKP